MSDTASEATPSPEALRDRDSSPTLTLGQRKGGATPPTPDVRLYHRAVVAPMEPPLRCAAECVWAGARGELGMSCRNVMRRPGLRAGAPRTCRRAASRGAAPAAQSQPAGCRRPATAALAAAGSPRVLSDCPRHPPQPLHAHSPPLRPVFRGLVRQLSIDQLDNEGRRVSVYDKALPSGEGPATGTPGARPARGQVPEGTRSVQTPASPCIPHWQPPPHTHTYKHRRAPRRQEPAVHPQPVHARRPQARHPRAAAAAPVEAQPRGPPFHAVGAARAWARGGPRAFNRPLA